jgi:hypothetical protein
VEAVEQAKEKVSEVGSRGRRKKDSLAKRLLVSFAASAVSGATAYAARKAPGFFQEKVVPRLKELASSGGTLEKAKKAVEGAVPSSVPGLGTDGQRERPRRKISDAQRAKQQRERAARRRERREALSR